MTPDQLQQWSIDGTSAYLRYLEEFDLGVQRIPVVERTRIQAANAPRFALRLATRVLSPELFEIRVVPPNLSFGPQAFRVIEYDGDALTMFVEVSDPALTLHLEAPQISVSVVSDLKFLVRNVKRWFEANGGTLALPEQPPGVIEIAPTLPLTASQAEAVREALSWPLMYVWGPPGSGKTRHVLVETVMRLLLAAKRVCILGPTNNSVEHALDAVLAATDGKLARDDVLRVGHPSKSFAARYPEVCEVQGLARRCDEIARQIQVYRIVLHCRRGLRVLDSAAMLQHQLNGLRERLCHRRRLFERLAAARRGIINSLRNSLNGSIHAVTAERQALDREIQGQLESVRATVTESDRLNGIVADINFTNLETIDGPLNELRVGVDNYLTLNAAISAQHEHVPVQEVAQRIDDLNEQLARLLAEATSERIVRSRVVGMTLDCFVGRFCDAPPTFDHLIVDEAGYAPLAKALTLFRSGVPITLLGDHKQLGPVCEMNDAALGADGNVDAIAWRRSALFAVECFKADQREELRRTLFETPEPRWPEAAQRTLTATHRFGQNLAEILDACVYGGIGLASAITDEQLQITVVTAIPNAAPNVRRQSQAEVEQIAAYLNTHPELTHDNESSFAVLTPYKNQVALLGDHIPHLRNEGRILTVHKAQGREWDTVLLSVVDGRFNRPWFTDTTNPQSQGLYVMNTAVSRARRRLVLVIDADYWSNVANPHDQLLSRLLAWAVHA